MSASTASQMSAPLGHQREVDDMVARVRADLAEGACSLFTPPPVHAPPSADVLDSRMCEELESIRREIDQIGDVLSSDPILLTKHAMALQALDRVDQVLGHLATVLCKEDKQAAIDQISMGDLKSRLLRRPLSN